MTGPGLPGREVTSTGFTQRATGHVDRIPAFDPRTGDHLWLFTMSYSVDPELLADPNHTPMFDLENLVQTAGPWCYYCEQPYRPALRHRRCKGRP